MTTLIDRLRGNPEQLSGWVLYEAADELDRQAREVEALALSRDDWHKVADDRSGKIVEMIVETETLKSAARKAIELILGHQGHCSSDDVIQALQAAIEQQTKETQ